MIPKDIKILAPWRVIDATAQGEGKELSDRIAEDIPQGHVLFGLKVTAVARRCDRDEVLFEVRGTAFPLAMVHMTWRTETGPRWPTTKVFESWDEWVREEMHPAHDGYIL